MAKSCLVDLVGPGKESTGWHILDRKEKRFRETMQVVMKEETSCLPMFLRITLREIVPTGRIFPLFSPRIGSPNHCSPLLSPAFFGSRKGWLFVFGRVRFLVKPTFFGAGGLRARLAGLPVRLIC
jgi:hypothetical protein